MQPSLISLNSLRSDPYCQRGDEAPMVLLAEAEIILGQDVATRKVFVVDGKDKLRQVVDNVAHDAVNVVVVEVDRESDDLRQLTSYIKIAKCR